MSRNEWKLTERGAEKARKSHRFSNPRYAPDAAVNPRQFGRCRQYLDGDVAEADAAVAALAAAYAFHDFYVYDLVAASPSTFLPWACLAPFAAEPAGRCHETYTCCEMSSLGAACALCATYGDDVCAPYSTEAFPVSTAACDGAYAPLFGNGGDWSANPHFDPAYASLGACAAHAFYPVSELLQGVVGAGAASYAAGPRGADDCADRAAAFGAVDAADRAAKVDFGVRTVLCSFPGYNTCSASLSEEDADLRWANNVATEAEIAATGASGTCAMWDGGSEGLGVLPSVPLILTLGDYFDGARNKGLQFVYVTNGYKTIHKNLLGVLHEGEVKDARQRWILKYGDHVDGRYSGGSMLHGTFTSVVLKKTLEDASALDLGLLALGYALVVAYAGFSMAFEGTTARARLAHVGVGVCGVLVVVCGLAASMGVACLMGIPFNAVSVQVLPFLLVGLGVNDMFLLAHNYVDVARSARGAEPSVRVGLMLGRSGPSITLTTCANFVAFLVAQSLGIRIVADFAAQAAIGVVGIYLGVLFGFTALLGVHARTVEPAAEAAEVAAARSFYRDTAVPAYASCVTHAVGKWAAVAAFSAAVISFAVVGFPRIESGFPLEQVFVDGSSPHQFWKAKGEFFSDEYFYVDFGEADYARKHPLLASVADPSRYSIVQQVESARKVAAGQSSWYPVFLQWTLPCHWDAFDATDATVSARARCGESNVYGSEALYNPRCELSDPFGLQGSCGPRISTGSLTAAELPGVVALVEGLAAAGADAPALKTTDVPRCSAWPVSYFYCDGVPCFEGHLPNDVFTSTAVLGVHPTYFYECFDLFLNYDGAHALYSPAFTCSDPERPGERVSCGSVDPPRRSVWRTENGDMDFSETLIWASDIDDHNGWVDLIDSVRKKLNAVEKTTGMQVFPSGSLFKFYSQFRWLEDALAKLLGTALACVYAIVALLFFAVQPPGMTLPARAAAAFYSALLLAAVVALILVTLLAIMGLGGLILNCFTVVTLVLAVGISVEFTAHFLHHYLLQRGSRTERTTTTLKLVLPPVVDGSVTTLLGILPMAFAKYPYIVKYYFFVYLIIICVGVAFGIVFLPALLACVGWEDPAGGAPAGATLLPRKAEPDVPDPRDKL